MHNNPAINILNNISKKAAKVLMRDYFELENIQSSPKGPYSYANKSKDIVQDILFKELTKAYPAAIINISELAHSNNREANNVDTGQDNASNSHHQAVDNNLPPKITTDIARILINPLDGLPNLARSLPFFAFSIILQTFEKNDFKTQVCLINSAYLGLTYHATKGNGAWLEKIERGLSTDYRMRVSSNANISQLMLGINNAAALNHNREAAILVGKLGADVRIIGSELMLGALLAGGKLDAAVFVKPDYNNLMAIKLLVTEAGGIVFNSKIPDLWVACSAAQYRELFKHFNVV